MVDGLIGRVSKLECVLALVRQDDMLAETEILDLAGPQAEVMPAGTGATSRVLLNAWLIDWWADGWTDQWTSGA